MRLKIFWDGNPEGTSRTLQRDGSRTLLWIFVERADGSAWPTECEVVAHASRTMLGRLLGSEAEVHTEKSGDEPIFSVGPLPRWRVPYNLRLRVRRKGDSPKDEPGAGESATVYVIPTLSRWLSRMFAFVATAVLAYLCWFVLTVSREGASVVENTVTKLFAAMGPVVAFTLPWASRTLRRELENSLSTFVVLVAACVVTSYVASGEHHVSVVNATPATVDLTKSSGQVALEPGATGIVSTMDQMIYQSLRNRFVEATPAGGRTNDATGAGGGGGSSAGGGGGSGKGGGTSTKKWDPSYPDDFFRQGNYCVKQSGSSEDSEDCLEFRGPHWYGKIQQALSPGKAFVVGCRAPGPLDDDYRDHWIRSGSCKTDPEIEVPRTLARHREQHPVPDTDPPSQAEACKGPTGEIHLRPFRKGAEPAHGQKAPPLLRGIQIFWPSEGGQSLDSSALPIWNITGNGEVSRLRLLPEGADGCNAHYGSACWTREESKTQNGKAQTPKRIERCSTLYAPPEDLSATLERGTQKIGTLWCAGAASRILGARVAARVSSFKVVRTDDRTAVLSTFDSALPALINWIFWCESAQAQPPNENEPASHRGELTLAQDFQPDNEWSLLVPRESSIKEFLIFVDGFGRWGTVGSKEPAADRRLFLWSAKSPPSAIVSADFSTSSWTRYSESKIYPAWSWIWTSDSQATEVMRARNAKAPPAELSAQALVARLADDRSAMIKLGGHVAPSMGLPCLIARGTGNRIGLVNYNALTDAQRKQRRAYDTVVALNTPNCDPTRSFFPETQTAAGGGQ